MKRTPGSYSENVRKGNLTRWSRRKLAYYENPNKCQLCGKAILPREGQSLYIIKRRKFCNHSCSTSYNNYVTWNLSRNQGGRRRKPHPPCKRCGIILSLAVRNKRIYCEDCSEVVLAERMLIRTNRPRSEFSVSEIRSHARYVCRYRKKICAICQYAKAVQVCHIPPVSSWPQNTPLRTVNESSYLVLLCPNHHWELDHNLLESRLPESNWSSAVYESAALPLSQAGLNVRVLSSEESQLLSW